MTRLLLATAASLCCFAAQAHAQDKLTATGTCQSSSDIEKVLADNMGAKKFRSTECETMVSERGKSVIFTHAGKPEDRVTLTGTPDHDGDLSVEWVTFGTGAPIKANLGFCNGGPLEDGRTAMVCSAAYDQGGVTMGLSVIFVGTPKK